MNSGILVPGGFGVRGVEGKIAAIEWARKQKKPFLGVCYGLQCAVIEFSRNVLGLAGANSSENKKSSTEHEVVIDMPEHNTGQMGGTMRLGKKKSIFVKKDSVVCKLYGDKDFVEERHRHRYEVNPKYIDQLEAAGLRMVAKDETKTRMEIIDLKDHPYFVGVQFHPEYLSRPLKPSPPYLGLILAAVDELKPYLKRGCRLSPRQVSDIDSTCTSDDEEEEEKVLSFETLSKLVPPPQQ